MKKPRTLFFVLAAAALFLGGCASETQMTAGPNDEYTPYPLTAGARPNGIPYVANGYEQYQ